MLRTLTEQLGGIGKKLGGFYKEKPRISFPATAGAVSLLVGLVMGYGGIPHFYGGIITLATGISNAKLETWMEGINRGERVASYKGYGPNTVKNIGTAATAYAVGYVGGGLIRGFTK